MSFFSGSSKLSNASPIPPAVPKAAAVALLHDHDFFLRCDPHYVSHKALSDSDTASGSGSRSGSVKLPPGLTPLPGGNGVKVKVKVKVKAYEVVDHVPNPVWSSTVVSREEFVDFEAGLWVRIRSPMGVVMETTWTVRERKNTEGEGGLELVEDVAISCSKLLLGIVRGQVEGNWRGIHGKIVGRLVEDAGKGGV
ncbi:Uu.00g037890.m01.CDS01 [Anthostomella pinea]|uniref:Uu.00g037890.m01.CDS01 n=1 Tax=Anthostomella pinea TaxID=933095 RepID=A0AAI8VAR1_9PEZI|nr:Uu.00g037890.m01.CDS01 [Anthostomella pinea]